MKSKPKMCVCEEMEASVKFCAAKTWQCPIHGQITVDKRLTYQPTTRVDVFPYNPMPPTIPYWPPYTPVWTSDGVISSDTLFENICVM